MYNFKSKLPAAVAILAASFLFNQNAKAIPTSIAGIISFSGTATTDTSNFLTATRFSNFEEVFVGSPLAVSGDYSGTSGAAVTMTPFIWNPPNASTPITPLWSFMFDGKTYSFDLSILHVDFASPTGLFLSGMGTAHLTGAGIEKLDTLGNWNFSAQSMGSSTFTFSSTTEVPINVPDGGSTVLLLGSGLCAFAFLRGKFVPAKA